MNNYDLLKKIDDWREQSLQLHQLEKEIAAALADGESEIYDTLDPTNGYHIIKSETKISGASFDDGTLNFSFIRPDADVVISAVPRSAKSAAGKIGGKISKGGGRKSYKTEAERTAAKRAAVRKYRAKKSKKK